MKKVLLLFGLLFVLASHAQSEKEKAHFVSLESEKNVAVETDFYIENIYDGRQVKENIGTVYVSLFNTKVSAKFKKPFVEELQGLLGVLYPKTSGKKAISVRINELYVTERDANLDSYKKKQVGSATVVLDIIEKKEDGSPFIVGTFFASSEDTRYDVTRNMDLLITAALKNCFVNYVNTKDVYKIAIPFNPDEKINADNLPTDIKAGVYLNYADVFSGRFLSLDDYTITKYQDGFCLLNNNSGRVENGFYGFSDGHHFYLNLFRFSTVKYYLKAEIMGPNYFINEVIENNMDLTGFYATYGSIYGLGGGLVGVLIISNNVEKEVNKIPLVIDRLTGAPTFLTDKYMTEMMTDDELLRKEFRKSDRSPSAKKAIYKKYYKIP